MMMVCRQTFLAPTYGGPINKLFVLPKRVAGTKQVVPSPYLVYTTPEKVVGLAKLPLDGNPNRAMALIAHPGQVSCCVSSYDGRYLLTAGGDDRAVHVWRVSTHALDAAIALAPPGLEPFLNLLEGGERGEFYQDLLDYFYYGQLRSQGLATSAPRRLGGLLPVDEAVRMMRALGCFPSQQAVLALETEVYYANRRALSTHLRRCVDLEQFIRLYVNHRPVFGLDVSHFNQAFAALSTSSSSASSSSARDDEEEEAKDEAGDVMMTREELIHCLKNYGEKMSDEEIEQCFGTLLGVKGGSTSTATSALPERFSARYFLQEVLGFEADSEA